MSSEASSSGGSRGESVVVDVGRRRSTCGYCKSGRRTSISHGLWAHSLTINDYQDLLDRGWRRSGCFLYKPEMETTCCPAYTIRLKAEDFSSSKEQLRVSTRMQRYLDGIWEGKNQELVDKSNNSQGCAAGDQSASTSQMESLGNRIEQKIKEEELLDYLSKELDLATQSFVKNRGIASDIQFPKCLIKKVTQAKRRRLVEGSEDLLYTSNLSFQIAAILRRVKPDENNALVLGNGSTADISPQNIAEELASALQNLNNIRNTSIKACNGHINFYSAVKVSLAGEDDQAVSVSNESYTRCESKGHDVERSQKKKRILEIRLRRSHFDPEEFALYKRYQIQVHNDEPDEVAESSYRRFLVDTPLIYVSPTGDDTVPPCGFGSFHQQYRIDGQLIAVGVVDILPKCLSSKYLFWDPDFAFLSLGKYSALQEIGWVKENQRHCPTLQYYYLGYYIHSCSKMRYKAAYRPSELLCPLRYEWVPYVIAKPLLDRKQYVVLSDYANAQKGVSLLSEEPGKISVVQHDDLGNGDLNDTYVDGDEKNLDPDERSSDDELYPEANIMASSPNENGNIGNLLLGLRGNHVRYKDLQSALRSADRVYLETQLLRYMNVVGPQLSEKMVYSVN